MDISRVKDITGKRFGRLVVISLDMTSDKVMYWFCRCDCGKTSRACGSDMKRGKVLSCGCSTKEAAIKLKTVHGMYKHPAYGSWRQMRFRCTRPNHTNYPLYGGRGISVCEKWLTFQGFWEDMGPSWAPLLSIDRIDTNGNYEMGNCRWATPKEQGRNRRNNRIIQTPKGPMSVSEAAETFGVQRSTIFARIAYGWDKDELLS